MSTEGSSALSIINSQGTSRLESQLFAARSFGSTPPILEIAANPSFAVSWEEALMEKTPQNLKRLLVLVAPIDANKLTSVD